MEVILLERIEKLGQMGDVVDVKPGYARNYLLPKGKALRATEENRARFERERAQLEVHNLERRQEAEAIAGRLEGFSSTLLRQASESAQLYGSVSARDIADAITAGGVTVHRGQILLDRPIKTLGVHRVRVALHPEVVIEVDVNVARTAEEAEAQAAAAARGESASEAVRALTEAREAAEEYGEEEEAGGEYEGEQEAQTEEPQTDEAAGESRPTA